MALHEKTEQQLEEAYENYKPYLNRKNSVPELYEMCKNCEKYCGEEIHDYEECKGLACFRNWLGLAYLNWSNGF